MNTTRKRCVSDVIANAIVSDPCPFLSQKELPELAMLYALIYPDQYMDADPGPEGQRAVRIWAEIRRRVTPMKAIILVDNARETLQLMGVAK